MYMCVRNTTCGININNNNNINKGALVKSEEWHDLKY